MVGSAQGNTSTKETAIKPIGNHKGTQVYAKGIDLFWYRGVDEPKLEENTAKVHAQRDGPPQTTPRLGLQGTIPCGGKPCTQLVLGVFEEGREVGVELRREPDRDQVPVAIQASAR